MEHDYKQFPELTDTQMNEFGFSSPHKQITEDFEAVVTKVIDGDTITLRTDFRDFEFPLRLLEIDALELSEGGTTAKEWLKGLIEGEKVEIRIDRKNRVGKYGRLLGKVIYQGIDVGDMALSMGYAFKIGKRDEAKIPVLGKILRFEQWF